MNNYIILAESHHEEVGTVTVYVGEVEAEGHLDAPDKLVEQARSGELDEMYAREVLATLEDADLRIIKEDSYIVEGSYTLPE